MSSLKRWQCRSRAGRNHGASRTLMALLLLGSCAGCGGPHESYVTGTVTIDGTPLPNGTVMFQPVGQGPITASNIESDGSFRVKTGANQGLASGEYIVTVQALSDVPSPGMTVQQLAKISLVPLSYNDKRTSTLRYQVEPGSNRIDLQLTSGGDGS